MHNSDTPNTGIGLHEAAAKIESIMTAGEADNHEPDNAAASEQAEEFKEDSKATAATDAPEETQLPDGDDNGGEEEDTASELTTEEGDGDEEAPADNQPAVLEVTPDMLDKLVTVKLNGKEEQVSLREALNGYQRTADYTRKSMALAEERRGFEAEKEAIKLERQQYAQLLPVLIEQIKASMEQEPDWQKLIDDDPVEYVRQERLWREKKERLAAAEDEQRRLAEIQAEEQRAALVRDINRHKQALLEKMPEWRNPDKWNAVREKLYAAGERLGFTVDEIRRTYDHRALMALYKAMRYDELMAKRPVPQKPNSPKPVKPGAAKPQTERKASDITRAKQRLARTGRVRDAATIFELME